VETLPREVCLDPRFLYNFPTPRFGVELPSAVLSYISFTICYYLLLADIRQIFSITEDHTDGRAQIVHGEKAEDRPLVTDCHDGQGNLGCGGPATLLGVSTTTIYNLARKGEIPATRVGREWRFARATLIQWAANGSAADQLSVALSRGRVAKKK
jgi:excisionase family DNA binding protein